jgi:GNAT superfamily N-acetyltransferase
VMPGSVPWTAAEVAQLMRSCRDGVLSCSGVACEAAACGLPFVAVRTAPDQVRLAQLLAEAGVPVCEVTDPVVATSVPAVCVGWDGLGAARVAARVREAWISSSLRPAVWSDAIQLLAWANDQQTRAASFQSEPITLAAHQTWLRALLRDPERRLLLDAGGTVRLARSGDEAVVSVTVAPDQRGRGEGRRLLEALADWTRAAGFCRRLVAWVRHDNPASLRLFSAAGYHAVAIDTMARHPASRFHLELT